MEFEWDEAKAAANLAKHDVALEETKTVFDDPLYVDFYDPNHSQDEHRYIMIGQSNQGRLLIVSYTERDDTIRLINVREVNVKLMKKVKASNNDELRPEYDLGSLRVRKLGPGRKGFADVVRLEPDVAEAFPNADSVNRALRSLIRVPKDKTPNTQRRG